MRIMEIKLKRNDLFDIITNVKKLIKDVDNLEKPGRYLGLDIFVSKEFIYRIKIDRADHLPGRFGNETPVVSNMPNKAKT